MSQNTVRMADMLKNIKVIEYDSIGSTNAEAKRYAISCEDFEPVLFAARAQSAGRGRLGRSFLSREGKGIYMSLLYFTDKALCDAISVTTAAAAFTAQAIETAIGAEMKIKWVNDIYNEHGKVAGILTETVMASGKNAIVVGIGINTGASDFPKELQGIASSIGEIDEVQRQAIIEFVTLACKGPDEYRIYDRIPPTLYAHGRRHRAFEHGGESRSRQSPRGIR